MEVKAIDVHVHMSDEASIKARGARAQQMARYFGRERKPVSSDEMADQYRARNMMAIIMNTTDQTITWGLGSEEMCVFLAFTDSTYLWGGGAVNDNDPAGNPTLVGGVMQYQHLCDIVTAQDSTH